MKILLLMLLAAAVVLQPARAVAEFPGPTAIVPAPYSTVYVPGGFDNNDKIELVGEGIFPNTCYRRTEVPSVEVDPVAKKIKIAPEAHFYDGICLQMLVRSEQVVQVGTIPAGTYQIVQEKHQEEVPIGVLQVDVAGSPERDNHQYAPVSQVSVESRDGRTFVRVMGSFTDSCTKLTHLAITTEPKVLVVLPITHKDQRPDCETGNFPFDHSVEVPHTVTGRTLIHVRTENGSSLNQIVDL